MMFFPLCGTDNFRRGLEPFSKVAGLFVTALGLCVFSHSIGAQGTSGLLNWTSDSSSGEIVVAVTAADDELPVSYQWFIDGRPLTSAPIRAASELVILPGKAVPGSTCAVEIFGPSSMVMSETLSFSAPAASSSNGSLTTDTSGTGSGSVTGTSATAVVGTSDFSVSVPSGDAVFFNLSSRGQVRAGNPMIVGLIISGTAPKAVLIRALGPTLANYGVGDALSNPKLTLYSGSTILAENDNWDQSSSAAAVSQATISVGATPFIAGTKDAALYAVLAPGAYTALVDTVDGSTGSALVEFYDASGTASAGSSRLFNLSTRGFAGSDNNVLITGFIVSGTSSKRMLIRGIGPSLAPYGVDGVMSDPKLTLYSGSTILAQNDDWNVGANATTVAQAIQSSGAFALPAQSHDAALVVTLPPGAYTTILSGGGDGSSSGNVLLELYELTGP